VASAYDSIVVGAGHDGLTAAFYLARAGARLGDGRRDAREVADHRTRRDEASDISLAISEAILNAFAAAHG
jgi:glycine/D-amino acid oxidase-like deaminating enzyme